MEKINTNNKENINKEIEKINTNNKETINKQNTYIYTTFKYLFFIFVPTSIIFYIIHIKNGYIKWCMNWLSGIDNEIEKILEKKEKIKEESIDNLEKILVKDEFSEIKNTHFLINMIVGFIFSTRILWKKLWNNIATTFNKYFTRNIDINNNVDINNNFEAIEKKIEEASKKIEVVPINHKEEMNRSKLNILEKLNLNHINIGKLKDTTHNLKVNEIIFYIKIKWTKDLLINKLILTNFINNYTEYLYLIKQSIKSNVKYHTLTNTDVTKRNMPQITALKELDNNILSEEHQNKLNTVINAIQSIDNSIENINNFIEAHNLKIGSTLTLDSLLIKYSDKDIWENDEESMLINRNRQNGMQEELDINSSIIM